MEVGGSRNRDADSSFSTVDSLREVWKSRRWKYDRSLKQRLKPCCQLTHDREKHELFSPIDQRAPRVKR